MENRRSYLDTVNAGRVRRPAAIEDLNRTLEELENRFGRAFSDTPPRAAESHRRSDEVARRTQSLSGAARQPDGQTDRITAALREELRQQMNLGVRQEFETLRQDIERATATTRGGSQGADLSAELDRLSGAVGKLAERGDQSGAGLLRSDIEELKEALSTLAREETVRIGNRHWDEFDRRWSAFEERQPQSDPAVAALEARLERISESVAALPDSVALRSLEEKVRTLASAIDQFSRQRSTPPAMEKIEQRLDEISRAIVASATAAQMPIFDSEPLERIEARIASLARQIEQMADEKPIAALTERLVVLSDRIAEMSDLAELPAKAVDRLAQQVAIIAGKLETGKGAADADYMLTALEERFAALTDMVEEKHAQAASQGKSMFAELDGRLQTLTDRLAEREAAGGTPAILEAIDARFADIADRLAQREPANESAAILDAIDSRFNEFSDQIRRDAARIDTGAIRSLEDQIAELSMLLARPVSPSAALAEVNPRLDKIEQSIAESRDAVLTAAREAAEGMAKTFVGSGGDDRAVSALAEDLKSLDALARRSDDRNSRTFEAIHDTLLKIVDRLGTMEVATAAPAGPPDRAQLDEAPSLDPAAALGLSGSLPPARQPARSPAEAAAAAVEAALKVEPEEKPVALAARKRKSVLRGLTRALKRDAAAKIEASPPSDLGISELALDAPLDPKHLNQPLEPGSGAPDLNAIMKRVRDERGQPPRAGDADAAKSDFIAAARRAAQAAAAEAETLKGKAEVAGRFGIGDLFRARRKMLLMGAAAIMIALAGLQLGKAFLNGDPQSAPQPIAQSAAPASLEAPSSPEDQATQIAAKAPEQAAPPKTEIPPSVAEPDPPAEIAPPATASAGEHASPAAPAPEVASPSAAGPRLVETTSSVPAEPGPSSRSAPTEATEPTEADATAAEPANVTASISVPDEIGPPALHEAAVKGNPKALFAIAERYAEGQDVPENLAEAAKWYEKAAEAGLAPAQYRIGNYYEKGLGVQRDIAKAKTWYQLAAAQGNGSAMHNLAVLFAMGAGGTPDNDSAARWFRKAAELGVKDSQFNLGILAAKGVGMPQDLEESYKWFALVAKSGDKDAAAKRDEVAHSLPPEQLEKARASVELWKPQAVDPAANTVEIPNSWNIAEGKTASIDMKQAIRNVQLILAKNGYDAGSPDGVMGARTKAAIAAFQKDNGLPSTGEIDEALVRKLLEKK